MTPRAAVLLVGAAALLSCSRPTTPRPPVAVPIADVLRTHTDSLMAIPGVVGVAQGECGGAPCILVLAAATTPALVARVPKVLDGYPVEIRMTGPIRAR